MIDPQLLSLFSVDDVLRNSLAWVPITLFFWALSALLAKSGLRLPFHKQIRRALIEARYPAFEVKVGLAMALLYVLFAESWPLYLAIQSVILFGATISWLQDRGHLRGATHDIAYGFFLLVNMFLVGASEAQTALRSTTRNYEFTLTSDAVWEAALLKVTSEAFVVMREPRVVVVLPNSEVKQMKRKELPAPHALISLHPVLMWSGEQASWLIDIVSQKGPIEERTPSEVGWPYTP